MTNFTNFSQPNLHGTDARLFENEMSTGVQTRQQAAARAASQASGSGVAPATPTTGVGRGTGLSTASTTPSSLATPLAAIGRGLDRLTPGQRKVADLCRALATETAGQVGTPGSPLATQAYPAGGRVSPTNRSRIPVETTKTPPVPPGVSAKNKTKRPATVVPTLNDIAPDAPPATQAALTVASILDASAAPFVPRTVMTPVVTTRALVGVGSDARVPAVSADGGAPRVSHSRASSVHSVSNTTVINVLETMQAQIAELRQSLAPAAFVPTENLLTQLDDDDMSSVSEHRTRHWVASANGHGCTYDVSGTGAGCVIGQPQPGFISGQGAASSIAGGCSSVAGTKPASVPKGKKPGASGVTFPAHTPTIPAMVLDSRPLVYNGESAVGPFLAQFQYTAELRGWPRETWGLQLLTSLEGRARSLLAVETFDRRPTFEEVAKKLRDNFGTDMSSVSYRHELELVRRGEKETIGSLGLRVKDLAMKAYPRLDADLRQELALAPFIRALNNPQLEQAIWATTPTTLQRAMEVALACENGMRVAVSGGANKNQKAAPRVHRINDDANDEHEQEEDPVINLTASVRALSEQVSIMARDMNQKFKSQADQVRAFHSTKGKKTDKEATAECFYCHEKGHYATDCPKKIAEGKERAKKTTCFRCDKLGHFARDCPERSSATNNTTGSGNGQGRGAVHQAPGQSKQ